MTHHAVWYTAPALRVAAGREPQFAEFEKNWLEELKPEGPLELEAFHDFLRSAWRKREVIETQNRLDASFLTDDPAVARRFDRLLRYEREFEARSTEALDRLRKLQNTRSRKPATILETFPDEVARKLYILDTESRHLNACCRARKAGLLDPDTVLRTAASNPTDTAADPVPLR